MSTVQTHLSRRNAYHSTIRRAPSNASSVSSDVSSTSSSSDGDDHQLTPTTTNRHTLYLNAIEANKTAAKLDRARQRRKAARDDLQVKQEWGTGFEVLSTSPRDPYNPWGFAPEGIEVDSVALEDPQPFSPALIPLTPPRREASLGSTSPDSTPPDPPSRTPSVRPKLYPLFIPSRPDERPRSFQPISNLAQPPIADRPRPISWAGQDAQAFQLDSQSGTVDEWGTEEVVSWSRMAGYPPQVAKVLQGTVQPSIFAALCPPMLTTPFSFPIAEHHITGPVLLTLDSNRLRLMGVVAFGTRFKLLESLRELQSGATPTPVAVVPAPPAPQPDTPRDVSRFSSHFRLCSLCPDAHSISLSLIPADLVPAHPRSSSTYPAFRPPHLARHDPTDLKCTEPLRLSDTDQPRLPYSLNVLVSILPRHSPSASSLAAAPFDLSFATSSPTPRHRHPRSAFLPLLRLLALWLQDSLGRPSPKLDRAPAVPDPSGEFFPPFPHRPSPPDTLSFSYTVEKPSGRDLSAGLSRPRRTRSERVPDRRSISTRRAQAETDVLVPRLA